MPASLPGVDERDEAGDLVDGSRQLPTDKQALIDNLDPTVDCSSMTPDPVPVVAEVGAVVLQVARIANGCLVIETTVVAEDDLEAAIASANAEPDVVAAGRASFASIDGATDPLIAGQQWWLDDLRVSELDALSVPAGVPKVRVAVIDTGIDDSHPDLAGLVVGRGSWAGALTNPHGTHVAGIIAAAANNDQAGRGIASGRVELLDVNFESSLSVASLIDWAVDHGAQVINMSFCENERSGDPCQTTPNPVTLAAVATARHRGVLLFASAGNCGPGSYLGEKACGGVENRAQFPSGYDGVIAVGAYVPGGNVAEFSTRNASVDVSAPGYPITSTGFYPSPGHSTEGGTSQSTPMVSGAAAVLLAHRPDVAPSRILSGLFAYARDAGPSGWDVAYGSGRIDPLEVARRLDAANPVATTAADDCWPAPGSVEKSEGGDFAVGYEHPDLGCSTIRLSRSGASRTVSIRLVGRDGRVYWEWSTENSFEYFKPAGDGEFARVISTVDDLGHIFVDWNPGRLNGVSVLVPTADGFDDLGTLPDDSGIGTFYSSEVVDIDDDGIYEIEEAINDCSPTCAEGSVTLTVYAWDDATFTAVPATDSQPDSGQGPQVALDAALAAVAARDRAAFEALVLPSSLPFIQAWLDSWESEFMGSLSADEPYDCEPFDQARIACWPLNASTSSGFNLVQADGVWWVESTFSTSDGE